MYECDGNGYQIGLESQKNAESRDMERKRERDMSREGDMPRAKSFLRTGRVQARGMKNETVNMMENGSRERTGFCPRIGAIPPESSAGIVLWQDSVSL